MKTAWKNAAAAALMAVAAGPVAAQQQSPIETRLEARRIVAAADGKETFAPAASARPGDLIEYVATYRNTTRQPIRNLQATLPIPLETELVAGSDRPAGAQASLDGLAFAAMPLKRRVRRGGQEIEEQVPLREYRYLRWFPGELGGERQVTFTARVKVVDNRPPSEPGSKGGGK